MQDKNSHNDEYASIINKVIDSKESITFLLIGRTGVGKSSTINSLVGSEVAASGKFEATTKDVEVFESIHEGVKYKIIDTPGLCDDLPEVGNDDLYLEKIKEHIDKIDIVWFVSELDATRVSSDEKRGIKLITNAFGGGIWSKSVIIFTYSDRVDKTEFDLYLKERSRIVKAEISNYAPTQVSDIPCVAVSNKSPILPNGKKWIGELFTQVFLRFSDDGAFSFLKSLEKDLGGVVGGKKLSKEELERGGKEEKPQLKESKGEKNSGKTKEKVKKEKAKAKKEKPRIEIDEAQKEKIKDSLVKRVLSAASAGAALGAKIGGSWGPVGTAVGGAVGAVIGGTIGWLF